ncbi:MAG: class I SAM-dependent methyltransferase [Burkholderiales bacterium]|nr:class I SAM-dependent methyltransferase [Burkholderiales bacterium]
MALEDFANRLARNARHWRKWARRRGIECFRIYDRDIPEFAFAVDIYGTHAHLQAYDRGSDMGQVGAPEFLAQIHATVARVLEMEGDAVVLKLRSRRHAGEQHQKTGVHGEDFVVNEGGHRFLVNLHAYLDTGLFLDHRNTRTLVAEEARGRAFLNLFCYTASFTVYAAGGGASSSVSVDLSNTYLEWAARNLALNAVDRHRHSLERADVLRWLEQAVEAGRSFDLIVLDPPAFSASKAMQQVFDVQRDHPLLLERCARLLAPGGVLYFSNNLRSFRLERVPAVLAAEEISARSVPEDFRNRRIHRCWRLLRRTA